MALNCRIDKVVIDKGDVKPEDKGKVYVYITMGPPPLPDTAAGLTLTFTSKAEIAEKLEAFETWFAQNDGPVMLALAQWLKVDNTMSDVSKAAGKTAVINMQATATVISVS
jgi:hypothetical protein